MPTLDSKLEKSASLNLKESIKLSQVSKASKKELEQLATQQSLKFSQLAADSIAEKKIMDLKSLTDDEAEQFQETILRAELEILEELKNL